MGLPDKGDCVDWIALGNGKAEISKLPLVSTDALRKEDLSSFLADNDSDDQPVVKIVKGEIHQAITDAEEALMQTDPYAIFEMGGAVVRVAEVEQKTSDG